MSEMIERVAESMWSHLASNHERMNGKEHSMRCYRLAARAAIEAMREPTEAMIEASNREWDGRMSHRSSGAWQAMIDEAMK